MKKVLLVLGLAGLGFGASAQDLQTQRKTAVKLNPLSLLLLTGNVAVERAVTSNQSAQVGVFFAGFSLSGLKYSGFGLTPEYRFYFAGNEEALNGVYLAPFLRYQSYNLTDKDSDDKARYSSMGGGAAIGWQKAWPGGFTLDIFAGPSINSGKIKSTENEDDYDLKFGMKGFGIRTGLTLGFAF